MMRKRKGNRAAILLAACLVLINVLSPAVTVRAEDSQGETTGTQAEGNIDPEAAAIDEAEETAADTVQDVPTAYSEKTAINSEETLKTAIEKGGEVTLDGDIGLSAQIEITKDVVLDLNGHKIANAENATIWKAGESFAFFKVTNGVTLTINDSSGGNGIINPKENDCYAVWVDNGNCIINGGTLYGNCAVVYLYPKEENGKASLEINGGTFSLKGHQLSTNSNAENRCHETINIYNDAAKRCTVSIKGGTYYQFDPGYNRADPVEGLSNSINGSDGLIYTNYLAEGYYSVAKTIEGDQYYEVYPDSTVSDDGTVTIPTEASETGSTNDPSTSNTITLPVNTLSKVAESATDNEGVGTASSLKIDSSYSSVTFDIPALQAAITAAKKDGDGNITLEVAQTEEDTGDTEKAQEKVGSGWSYAGSFSADLYYQMTAEGNKTYIHDFEEGTVTVSIPFTAASGYKYRVYYVPENAGDEDKDEENTDENNNTDTIEEYIPTISNGRLSVTLPHFSNYVILKTADTSGTGSSGSGSSGSSGSDSSSSGSESTAAETTAAEAAAAEQVSPKTGEASGMAWLIGLAASLGIGAAAFYKGRKYVKRTYYYGK